MMAMLPRIGRSPKLKRTGFSLAVLASLLACQLVPTPPPLKATPRPPSAADTPGPPPVAAGPTQAPVLSPPPDTPAPPPGELALIPYRGAEPFAGVDLQEWQPGDDLVEASGPARFSLPYPLARVRNRSVADGLTLRQREQLAQQGFVIVHSRESHFDDLRHRVALFYGQPYYLTSDAAYHALKISFDELLSALEREELKRRLQNLIQATLAETLSYRPLVAGSDLEQPAELAAAYLAVALRLLDPTAALDPELEPLASAQVAQIMAARGVQDSVLIPAYQDDFTRYRPPGRYAATPELQGYYRALTWLERVVFPPDTNAGLNFAPLIVTLALRQAQTADGPAAVAWARLAETLNFISGPRAAGGPAEYAILMDQAFGRNLTILGLQDAPQRETFRMLLGDLPFPQLDPPLPLASADLPGPKTWSFFGARYRLDGLILENLVPAPPSNRDAARLLPGGLELMVVLGSSTALEAMQQSGAEFRAYPDEIGRLRAAVESQTEAQWSASARSLWLEGFRAQLEDVQPSPPGAANLPYLETPGWAYKELNSALGSWAELQYDISAFAPAPAEVVETRTPAAPPAPAFVEPDPQVFYRLSRLAFSAAEGLKQRDLVGVFSSSPAPDGLGRLLLEMLDLADRLQRLGDIAVKELRGEPLEASDFALIQAPLGPAEKRLFAEMLAAGGKKGLSQPPWTDLAELDYGGERVLQVGVGGVDRIYVLAPLNGEVLVAQGGVYAYYEFSQPRARVISQTGWRRMLVDAPPPPSEWVARSLYLPEGVPLDVLAYRVGEFYRVRPAAVNLALRGSPGRDARIVQIAAPGEILEIIAGPVEANGLTWWRVRVERQQPEPVEGWIFENQDWIERAWNY